MFTPRPLCYNPQELILEKCENENKIFVPRKTYQDLCNQQEDSTQSLLVVNVASTENPTHTLIASIAAPHSGHVDEVYMPTWMLEVLGAPDQIHLNFIDEPLPMITKLQLRILDHEWALQDPVEALQAHLEDYYVLQENTTLLINTPFGTIVSVFVEKLVFADESFSSVGRIANGDTELEILRCEEEVEVPVPAPAPAATAIPVEDWIPAYVNPSPKSLPVLPTQEELACIRQARLAKFSN